MSQAERIARLEQEVARLTTMVERMRLSAGKDAIPVGMCHKGFDLDEGPCPKEGPYNYQRGCRGLSDDGEHGCTAANSAYYKTHPRGGKGTPVAVRGVNGKQPAKKVASAVKKRAVRG